MIRVLAFTCSFKRPLFLRHCLIQMQMQSYPCSHGIYINSNSYMSAMDTTNYCLLLNDIKISKGAHVKVSYGKQGHQHFNHMAALQQFDLDDFDLFIKIDDDDIYRLDYVKNLVSDYKKNSWDFSATSSTNVVNESKIDFVERMFFTKPQHKLYNHPLDQGLASTYAFSRKAIKKLIQRGEHHKWETAYEDPMWLKWMIQDEDIVCAYRESKDYTYFIHDKNFCLPSKTN